MFVSGSGAELRTGRTLGERSPVVRSIRTHLGNEHVKVTFASPLCSLTQSATSPNVAVAGTVCTNGGPLGTLICNLAESYVFFSPLAPAAGAAAEGAGAEEGEDSPLAADAASSGFRPSRRAFSRAAFAARSRLSASICSRIRFRAARSSSFSVNGRAGRTREGKGSQQRKRRKTIPSTGCDSTLFASERIAFSLLELEGFLRSRFVLARFAPDLLIPAVLLGIEFRLRLLLLGHLDAELCARVIRLYQLASPAEQGCPTWVRS